MLRRGLRHCYVLEGAGSDRIGAKTPGEVVERGPGRGDQVGEKRGFGIQARIGDRTKRSRACSGSGGTAGGSPMGIAGLLGSVSLFCWICRCDMTFGMAGTNLLLFESLFCWICRCDLPHLCRDRTSPTKLPSILGSLPANLKRISYLFALICHQDIFWSTPRQALLARWD